MKLRIMGTFLAVLVLFAGCGKRNGGNISTGTFTIEEEPAASVLLDGTTLELPDYISIERVSENTDYFYMDGDIVGGITVFENADNMEKTELQDYVDRALNVTTKIYDTAYDYMASNGNFCHTIVSINSQDGKEFYHYFYKGEQAEYDVWIDNGVLDTRDMHSCLKSLHSEDLYNPQDYASGNNELPLMALRYSLPDGITRQPTMTTRDLFNQEGTIIGGVEQITNSSDAETFQNIVADLMYEMYNKEFTVHRIEEKTNTVLCCQADCQAIHTTHYLVAVGDEYYDVWANNDFIQPNEVLTIAESCKY